ncbi:MAG: TIGR02206 family membrane protein [Saprospiraceae bacterium]|nr:TIGR02206 family membrane protein [Saprospiraceae bacterium]
MGNHIFLDYGRLCAVYFTPTLTESLPHYEAVRYWLVHAVIILGALYGLIVYRFDLTFMDALRSAIGLNLLAALIFPVNIWLNANYMYLNGKPPGQTFYDLLGPWPDYILVLEFVVIVFFGGILYLVRKLRARPVIVK